MGIEQDELYHDAVDINDFINKSHYYNEVEFYIEFDKLWQEFDFLFLDDETEESIPLETDERYNVFKQSTAQYHYLDYIKEYKNLSLRQNNIHLIKGLLAEIDAFIDNPKIAKDNPSYNTTFLEATRFINKFCTLRYENYEGARKLLKEYGKEQVDVYVYLLHRENYFENFAIPSEAFNINLSNNPFVVIGTIYAEYFLLANELRKQEKECEQNFNSIDEKSESDNIYIRRTKSDAEAITIDDLLKPEFKKIFGFMLDIMKSDRPLTQLLTSAGVKSKDISKNEFYIDKEMRKFNSQILLEYNAHGITVIDKKSGTKELLSHLFAYMIANNWFAIKGNLTQLHKIISSLLFNNKDQTKHFTIDRSNLSTLIKKIESDQQDPYSRFIQLMVSSHK